MKIHLTIYTLLLSLLSLFSCATVNEYPVSSDEHYREFADVKLSLRYLDRDDMIARHGTEENPFINIPTGLINKDTIMVFELQIESQKTAVQIKQKTVNLQFETISETPISEYHLKELWKNDERASSRQTDLRLQTIGTHVRQGMIKADPENPLNVYLVFVDKFPSYGSAVLTLPIMTQDMKDSGIIEFPFEFTLAYIKPDKADFPVKSDSTEDSDNREKEKKSIFQ